jgi:hypothetical protein
LKFDDARTQISTNTLAFINIIGEMVTSRDVNGARIDRMILYHPLPRHLKYSLTPSSFPASGRILPSSPSPRIPTVPADIHQF